MGAFDNPLAAKLSGVLDLGEEDRRVLDGWCAGGVPLGHDQHLVREGDKPVHFCVVLDGWAHRYKLLPSGGRQIVGFMLPGDTCDLYGSVLPRADHGIAMLTPGRVAFVPQRLVEEAAARRPGVERILRWCALADASLARTWLANNGRRNARERLAHLLCELWLRADQVGLARGRTFDLPATQDELADALALTPVHVNRTLRGLQGDGLVDYQGREFTLPDLGRLAGVAGFDPAYLHLGGPSARDAVWP